MKITLHDKRHLHTAARQILEHAGNKKILAFYGAMGAGKTTLIKSVCEVLGAIDVASSPTFTLVNEYRTKSGEALFHIDFYRIKNITEAFDIGIEEYLGGDNYCFIEWPELAEEILPGDVFRISITVGSEEERILEMM